MKSIFLTLLFALALVQLSFQCTQDSDCPSGQECCAGQSFVNGTCYDPSVSKCATCTCIECFPQASIVCSTSAFGEHASCCPTLGCYNPDTDLCCTYHIPHSSSPVSSTCANDGKNQCCGATCQREYQICCTQTSADVQYYTCPNNVACCGDYSCCAAGQTCSSGSATQHNLNDYCMNSTSVPTPTPTATPTPSSGTVCGGNVCGHSGDACCGNTCYASASYTCFGTSSGNLLCAKGMSACGNACYSASSYYCCNNQLYQNGQTSPCSTSSPTPTPTPSQPSPTPTPSSSNSVCGGKTCGHPTDKCCQTSTANTCYDPSQYTCASESGGNVLCPVGYSGCGSACYSTSQYKCCNGELKQPSQSC